VGGYGSRQRGPHAHLLFFVLHWCSFVLRDHHDSLISELKPVTSSLIAYPKAGELSFLHISK
jgi:hypothetical protein